MNMFLLAISVLLIFMTMVFALAMFFRDNSIVDVAYGLAFVLVCWAAYLGRGIGHPRQLLVLGMTTLWGVRLATHIFLRKRGEGEDFRYRRWREEWGGTFIWRSYLQIFILQGVVVFVVALPILLIINHSGPELGALDLAGCLVWLFGFGFEAVGDWQLLRFKKDDANRGHIIQSGLWRFTRHPNYFGEATLWWGLFLIALNVPYGVVAVLSPVLIGFLLLKVSGIPMLEIKYQGHPEFEAYRERTNAFFPWFPKNGQESEFHNGGS
jgi:steroid 5-alpha reductase family enzyme